MCLCDSCFLEVNGILFVLLKALTNDIYSNISSWKTMFLLPWIIRRTHLLSISVKNGGDSFQKVLLRFLRTVQHTAVKPLE